MNKNIYKLFAILCVMAIATLACSFGSKKSTEVSESNEPAQEESDTKSSSEANPDDSNNNNAKDDALLGEEYRSEGGGFSIRKVKGYDFKDVFGIVAINAMDANPEVGPGLTILGGIADGEYSNEEMMDKIRAESDAIKIGEAKKIKVNGIIGLMADVGGRYDDQPIKGQVVVVMVTPTQQFNLIALAPESRWKELEPLFDAVLRSAEFFEPDPDAIINQPSAEVEENYEVPTVESNSTNPEGGQVRQWATSATASSEYGSVNWAAHQATGEPNVDDCGDNGEAWASKSANTLEWIELTYDIPVIPTEINIYQSYNPSQVVEVQVIDKDGYQYSVWAGGVEEVANCPDLMTITLDLDYEIVVNKVMVIVDQSIWNVGWDEIDAVELVGQPEGD